MGYVVKEKLKKGVRWYKCHIHSYGHNAPKPIAVRFAKVMRELYGSKYNYKVFKNQ